MKTPFVKNKHFFSLLAVIALCGSYFCSMQAKMPTAAELAALSGRPESLTVQDLINSNELPSIVYAGPQVILDLSDRGLTGLDGLQNILHKRIITTLRLEDNRIGAVPAGILRGFSNLRELDLTGNQLFTLPARLFVSTRNLQFLHLSENPLSELPQGLFAPLRHLQQIEFEYAESDFTAYYFNEIGRRRIAQEFETATAHMQRRNPQVDIVYLSTLVTQHFRAERIARV